MEKYALLTGASGEIGQAIAAQLADNGYNLILHYNKNKEAIERIKVSFPEREIISVQADLSVSKDVQKIVQHCNVPIDLVVHNAGIGHVGLLTDMADEEIQKMNNLHLTNPILLIKRLLPSMVTRKSGNIVVISSIWGLTGASCEVVYSTVKGGLNTFVKALAKEMAPSGIRVNGVAPGMIDTKMNEHFTEEDKQKIKEEIPIGRFGSSGEVADLVTFLASDRASYISGQIVSINGAWYC
ncbi:elongation factor P 5-aminopentanone reductase [Pseudalkalibacillus caeni]|uniref:SDR family oxidoreductase n=1 Tax=Exobacillus caeni TaxID=2574798 RepID=A0A5R9F978_9BACL|nr:SDR family oxidoreductase [Pseudalkalibacillus caeni]TLS37393.1 SDR family oxidoreductase [Pseudalkalibacillus caeni]